MDLVQRLDVVVLRLRAGEGPAVLDHDVGELGDPQRPGGLVLRAHGVGVLLAGEQGVGRLEVEPDEDVLEDGIAFAGVAQFPARVKCALLSWMAFKDATSQALSTQEDA